MSHSYIQHPATHTSGIGQTKRHTYVPKSSKLTEKYRSVPSPFFNQYTVAGTAGVTFLNSCQSLGILECHRIKKP